MRVTWVLTLPATFFERPLLRLLRIFLWNVRQNVCHRQAFIYSFYVVKCLLILTDSFVWKAIISSMSIKSVSLRLSFNASIFFRPECLCWYCYVHGESLRLLINQENCGYSEDSIPQLQTVSDFLKSKIRFYSYFSFICTIFYNMHMHVHFFTNTFWLSCIGSISKTRLAESPKDTPHWRNFKNIIQNFTFDILLNQIYKYTVYTLLCMYHKVPWQEIEY